MASQTFAKIMAAVTAGNLDAERLTAKEVMQHTDIPYGTAYTFLWKHCTKNVIYFSKVRRGVYRILRSS